MSELDPYGPGGRKAYLHCLAEDFGIPFDYVQIAADMLGPAEDFDGLLSELWDLSAELED